MTDREFIREQFRKDIDDRRAFWYVEAPDGNKIFVTEETWATYVAAINQQRPPVPPRNRHRVVTAPQVLIVIVALSVIALFAITQI
jgi:hypothetical protein